MSMVRRLRYHRSKPLKRLINRYCSIAVLPAVELLLTETPAKSGGASPCYPIIALVSATLRAYPKTGAEKWSLHPLLS